MINSATKSIDNKPNYLKVKNENASIKKPAQKKSQQFTQLKKTHQNQNNYANNTKNPYVLDAALHNDPENLMQFQDISEAEDKEIEYYSSLNIDFSTNGLDQLNPNEKSDIEPTLGKSPSNTMNPENMHNGKNDLMQTPYLSDKEYLTLLNIDFFTNDLNQSNPNKKYDIEATLKKGPSNPMSTENMHNAENDLMLSKAFQETECEDIEYISSSNTDMIAILHEETERVNTYKSNINTETVYKKDNISFTSAAEIGQFIESTYIDQHTTLNLSEIDFYSTFFTQYDNASQTPSITSSSDNNTPPTPDWEKNSSHSK